MFLAITVIYLLRNSGQKGHILNLSYKFEYIKKPNKSPLSLFEKERMRIRTLSILFSSVADPGCLSRIPDMTFFHPGSASKNLNSFTQKKGFLSSRKYDPGCSSRIRIMDFYPHGSRIPGSGGQKGTRSRIT